MSADMPGRPDTTDDLDQAYARAHALADDARGPSAAVRANVLAAARAVAAESAGRATAETVAPLTLVAPPVGDVGRGRSKAINLPSWRVRSGAAFCAVLLVGMIGWRFDEHRRVAAGEQVAMAELRLAEAPTSPLRRELPLPPMSGASIPYAPPPVVDDRVDSTPAPVAVAKLAPRDKDVIVAQLEQQAVRAAKVALPADALAQPRRAQPAAAPAPVATDAAGAAPPAPVVVASNAPDAKAAPEQEPVTVTVRGATQVATAPAMPPSVLQRRIALAPQAPVANAAPAPVAKPAAPGDTTVADAAADEQRVEIAGSRPAFSSGRVSDASKKAAPNPAGSLVTASARLLPMPLHAAADRGDIETLNKLLANATTPVDAPDATGRTALLHAVLAQQAAAVRLLLAAGADPARADQGGLTPRAAARSGANAEIAALLAAPR